ncbi:hypothetical protein BATDEDRAFT_23003 [Batrachochytrium dendrobatidis JAM81]|uniref:HAUS augmin-like complex subunit 3 N-terminal domain-containing protein n=1 Tax=Batrachochytrium dendrobatidis (strain JAM81 / FGSC 10211) TaxID=684364 RepID=F4NWF8_BATDJ|nr:uncharacterized protein BATDEDRAFT_23003 [Batrachochytrium dendrobatidis JAM81]EGF82822.1 hypothetical protein BATDEDRAFT_23003 [Batrachochytrium dendrobatidis JAM81]|eukprot:XP_006676681.1 hypothetical protein BATDEDRAFT_23003 [Batrachochytrium dendrobatidis JAM81]
MLHDDVSMDNNENLFCAPHPQPSSKELRLAQILIDLGYSSTPIDTISNNTATELAKQLQWTFQLDSTHSFVDWLSDTLNSHYRIHLNSDPSMTTMTEIDRELQHIGSDAHLLPTTKLEYIGGFDVLSEEEALLWESLQASGIDYESWEKDDHSSESRREYTRPEAVYSSPAQIEHIKSAHQEIILKRDRLERVQDSVNYQLNLQNDRIVNASAKLDLAVDQCVKSILSVLDVHSDLPTSENMLVHHAEKLKDVFDKQQKVLEAPLEWADRCQKTHVHHGEHFLPSWAIQEIKRLKCMQLEYLSRCSSLEHPFTTSDVLSTDLLSSLDQEQSELKKLRINVLEQLWTEAATRIESRFYNVLYQNKMVQIDSMVDQMQQLMQRMERRFAQNQLVSILLNSEAVKIKTRQEAINALLGRLEHIAASTKSVLEFLENPVFAEQQPSPYYIADHDRMAVAFNKLIPLTTSFDASLLQTDLVDTATHRNTVMTSTNALLKRLKALHQKHVQLMCRFGNAIPSISSCTDILLQDCFTLCNMVYAEPHASVVLSAPREVFDQCGRVRKAVSELQPLLQQAAKRLHPHLFHVQHLNYGMATMIGDPGHY